MHVADLRQHRFVVPALLIVACALGAFSAVGDSATFDEVSHLTAGYSYLRTGDFRLAPDHPPLGKIWCAWPLLFASPAWVAPDEPDWILGNVFPVGAKWLFELNDGQGMLVTGRVMMLLWLLATCAVVYFGARQLFGPAGRLLALVIACFCPSLLAHGHLVTTDLPITLFALLSLVLFARFLRRPTILRLVLAGLALAAATLSKFSWPLLLPGLLAIAVVDLVRVARGLAGHVAANAPARNVKTRIDRPRPASTAELVLRRAMLAPAAGCAMLLIAWLGIWTCYGWRSSMLAVPDRPLSPAEQAQVRRTAKRFSDEWQASLYEPSGAPQPGITASVLRRAVHGHFLPDAYLFGLASTLHSTSGRLAYLMGAHSSEGWRSYFPIAFAIKTPVATMLLLAAALVAIATRRARPRDAALAVGLTVFVIAYSAYVIRSNLNIGHRHLLPVYPALYVLAGAGAAWLGTRAGRVLVGAAVVWLVGANLWIRPHYLAYFNELIGGPGRGHLYLVDSNLDWGQDMLRLAAYHRRHPDEALKLAYFGSAPPAYYVPCSLLPSFFDFPPPAELTAGTYVVSATQWAGVYLEPYRDSFWTPPRLARLAEVRRNAERVGANQGSGSAAAALLEEARIWSSIRLVNRLRHRAPDQRIGYSLFVYRLTEPEVNRLSGP